MKKATDISNSIVNNDIFNLDVHLQNHYALQSDEVKNQLNNLGFLEYLSNKNLVNFMNKIINLLHTLPNDVQNSIINFVISLYFDPILNESEKRKLARCIAHSLTVFVGDIKEYLFGQLELSDLNVLQSDLKSLMILINVTKLHQENVILFNSYIIPYTECVLGVCISKLRETGDKRIKGAILSNSHLCIQITLCIVNKFKTYCSGEHLAINMLNQHILYLSMYPKIPLDLLFNSSLLVTLISYVHDGIIGCIRFYREIVRKCSASVVILSVINSFMTVLRAEEIIQSNFKSLLNEFLETVFNFYDKYPNDNYIVHALARVMQCLARYLASAIYLITDISLSKFVLCIWLHLDHFVDSVKYSARDTMNILINNKDERTTKEILKLIKENDRLDYRKCAAMCCLSKRINLVSEIIQLEEPFVANMIFLLNEDNNYNYIIRLYETLMSAYHQSLCLELWYNLWVEPVITWLKNHDSCEALEVILVNAVKMESSIVFHLIDAFLDAEDLKYKIVIKCLAVLKKCNNLSTLKGLNSTNSEKLWNGCLPFEVLQRGVTSHDHEVSITTASLIVHSVKSEGHCYSEKELNILKEFIILNIANKTENLRQQTINVIKEMIIRLSGITSSATDGVAAYLLEKNKSFTLWIFEFCVKNLFPGAAFGRRNTALSILVNLNKSQLIRLDEDVSNMLLYCLTDSYEVNKELAIKLLSGISPSSNESDFLNDSNRLFALFETGMRLCENARPSDNVSGAYIFQFLCSRQVSLYTLNPVLSEDHFLHKSVNSKKNCNDAVLACLDVLLSRIKIDLKYPDDCLLKTPVYGKLYTIRHFMKYVATTTGKNVSFNIEWKTLIEDLIPVCLFCSKLALEIVANPHPEGYVPLEMMNNSGDIDDDGHYNINNYAQFRLVCGWRTIKEASLLLSDFSRICYAIHQNNITNVVDKSYVALIGEELRALLEQIIHRGAFEQVYLAFSQLCYYLWRFPDDDIRTLPKKWLFDILTKIRGCDNQFCSSRRSAGLPFIVQALLVSEKDKKKNKSVYLDDVMELLFDTCTTAVSSNIAGKIHALNILRMLFKNKQLGEEMLVHIEKAIIIGMSGIKSTYWPERNSSTLLLSSVIIRIFGVPRSRDKIAWKNKMTSQMFFRNYPSLFDFFLKQLQINHNSPLWLQSSIYPVLLILSRLYTSSCEISSTEEIEPNQFVMYIYRCSACPILKIRELSAVAISSFITPDLFVSHINVLWKHVQTNFSENCIHGLLLQLEQLLQNVPPTSLSEMEHRLYNDVVDDMFEKSIIFLSSVERSYITKEVYVRCLLKNLIIRSSQNMKSPMIPIKQLFHLTKDFSNCSSVMLIGQQAYEDIFGILLFCAIFCRDDKAVDDNTVIRTIVSDINFINSRIIRTILDILFYVRKFDDALVADKLIPTYSSLYKINEKVLSKFFTNAFTIDYFNKCYPEIIEKKNGVHDILYVLKYVLINNTVHVHVDIVLDIFEQYSSEDVILSVLLCLNNYINEGDTSEERNGILLRILNRSLNSKLDIYAEKIVRFVMKYFYHFCAVSINNPLLTLKLWTYLARQSLFYDFEDLWRCNEFKTKTVSLTNKIVQRFSNSADIDISVRTVGLVSWILINARNLYDTDIKQQVFASDNILNEDELSWSMMAHHELQLLLHDKPSLLTQKLENDLLSWLMETCSLDDEIINKKRELRDILKFVINDKFVYKNYYSYVISDVYVGKVVAIEKMKLIFNLL